MAIMVYLGYSFSIFPKNRTVFELISMMQKTNGLS